MKRKARNTTTTTINKVTRFQPLFRELFEGANYAYVDTYACIHFTKIRQTMGSGVKKLTEFYDRTDSQSDNNELTRFAFGADTPFINPLF